MECRRSINDRVDAAAAIAALTPVPT
jgi:hypothetical protein